MTIINETVAQIWDTGFWGPVTATLDWCEVSPNPGPDPDPNTLLIAGDLLGKLPVLEICSRDGEHVL